VGSPAIIKGGWLRQINETKNGKLIRIQNNTYDRMKLNSVRDGGEVESVSEIIDRLLDNWDRNH
jgi:hypothetical protein